MLSIIIFTGLSEFPYKGDIEDENNEKSDEMECCICFDSRDENGSLPSIMCENCNNCFHTMCLYQVFNLYNNVIFVLYMRNTNVFFLVVSSSILQLAAF